MFKKNVLGLAQLMVYNILFSPDAHIGLAATTNSTSPSVLQILMAAITPQSTTFFKGLQS